MIVSIGIPAYNEAGGISNTIESLFRQSAFHQPASLTGVSEWEIVVVPNGCTDDTAYTAERALRSGVSGLAGIQVSYLVHEIAQGGKSNAWNHYIHEVSRPDADVIIMMDSDIEFGHSDTIINCLAELRSNEHAKVVVDLPLKDFEKKSRLSWLERLSVRHSRSVLRSDEVAIAGSFYCAAAGTLRQIWMPVGLSSEDGFLRGMVITDNFRCAPDPRRVVRAENASHYYEGLTDLRSIFRHELRIVIGWTINNYFMWDFLTFATDPRGPGAGVLIRDQTAIDPAWFQRFIVNQIRSRGWFVLPRGTLFRRLNELRGVGWVQAWRRLPIALAGTVIDFGTFWVANKQLRSGEVLGFW